MISIFFSIINDFCLIAILKNDIVISSLKKYNRSLHSDNFISEVNNILFRNNFHLSDLKRIYFISEPGEQTGIRVSVSFVTAMKILSDGIEVFSMNGLDFQKGRNENCLSVISSGYNTKRYWVNYYEQNKLLIKKQTSLFDEIEVINSKKEKIFLNFENIDFVKNFLFLKEKFERFEV